MKHSFDVFIILIILLCTSCETFNSMNGQEKPLVYDSSVPSESSSLLGWSRAITVRKFNGASVSWNRPIYIPSGEHEFVVDYNYVGPNYMGVVERHISNGITVRFNFVPGHEYSLYSEEGTSSNTVGIFLRDNTELAEIRAREKAKIEEDFKTALPVESTEPTMLEGFWVWTPKGWSPRKLYINGNAWQYDEDSVSDKGLFTISGNTITMFALYHRWGNDEWTSITDYLNAVFKYQFIIEADGSLRMKTIEGFSKDGPFYRDGTQ